MRSMRLMGAAFLAATWMGFQSSTAQADATAWSTNAASCVPSGTSGLFVTAGAVTAGAGATVTLYCGITRSALSVGFNQIEITYKGSGILPPVSNATAQTPTSDLNTMAAAILARGVVTSELIEMSKATGQETVKCGIQSKGSSAAIVTEKQICENSEVDFNNHFYYLRIVVKSGLTTLQQETIYGSSLTAR
jgi:hypothetical protein